MESRDFTSSKSYEDSGPMTISDLHHSVPNSNASKRKKEFKRQKAQHDKDTTGDTQQKPNTKSTIEEPILNRLRSRLDPTYNTTNASSHTLIADSNSLPEPSSPAVDKPVKRTKKRKNKSRDENTTNDRPTEADLMASETQLDTSATQVPVQDVES